MFVQTMIVILLCKICSQLIGVNFMKKILITGGAGFIGSTLANHLGEEHVVIVVDDLSMGKVENLDMTKNITFIEGMLQRNP